VELCPLVLVVSGTVPPCAGGQWNFAPLCWWSVELCSLVLVVSGTLPPCAGRQWNFAPLCWWPVEALLLCFSCKAKDVNVWVVFSKLKPQYSGLIECWHF
ncbi:unnamed protein product, partial [Staurois parvus]